jgi:iron complex outermembrane recepter protein
MNIQKSRPCAALACAAGCLAAALPPLASSAPAAAEAPVKTLGTVTVIGTRPTSLPTHIPTTIEGITALDIAEKVNASDAEDALKYFPSLLVRKRYIGDYDHAVLASRASGTGNSARSLVYADGILLSNLLGNGATFTPRWGMVTPEEIERVDVLYGPFSAAYPGNSVGAVVDYVTRMPDGFEGHVRASSFAQSFDVYRTHETYSGYQTSASIGDRFGAWSLWLNYNRLDNDSQPLSYANKLLSAGTVSTAGLPVSGAVAGRNPRNQDWVLLGATSQSHTIQDHAKAKVAYDFSPTLRATYTLGYWVNEATRTSESWLRDAAGNPVYGDLTNAATSFAINIDGRRFTLAPTDLAPSRADLEHFIHGLSVRSSSGGRWDWEAAASLYDYAQDEVRSPTVFVANANTRGAGRIADMHGTGWHTVALKGTWRPQGSSGMHLLDFGYQRDAAKLDSRVHATGDWIGGSADSRIAAFQGKTTLQSVYAQDTWAFARDWRATLGGRFEEWRASDGALGDPTPGLVTFAERTERYFSPKLALAHRLSPFWTLKASAGRAVRMPTVSELYQGSLLAGQVVNNDPNLQPERSWTGELTAERSLERGSLRTTAFHEDTRDALYSQINVAAGGTVATIQNVDHIRTRGLEVAYQVAELWLAEFDLAASLTYAHSRIVENDRFRASVGKWQPRVPEWRGNVVATYRLGEKWSATLAARYSGKQYNQLDNSDPNGLAFTGTSNFFTVDARVRYRITQRMTTSLSFDNLNEDNYWNFHHYPQRSYAAEVHVDF